MIRRHFRLVRGDEDSLNATGLEWETLADSGCRWVIIRRRPLPAGFDIPSTDVALVIPPLYPDTQIDSVLFRPCPRLTHGLALSHSSSQVLDGDIWTHLCRHRTASNAWRPGLDDIASHLALVDCWLMQSLRSTK
jgi:hypothetical protein